MKIGIISDLHGLHIQWETRQLHQNKKHFSEFLFCDVIIFAGDLTNVGTPNQVDNVMQWFSELTYAKKIFIGGNHDFFLDSKVINRFTEKIYSEEIISEFIKEYSQLEYLKNSSCEFEGIKFWGSPDSLPFYDWAFMSNEDELDKIYKSIPNDTDVIITHGPVHRILDRVVPAGIHTGSKSLEKAIKRIKPKLHICGHIHEGYGVKEIDGIIYINASSVNDRYDPINAPIIIEI